MVTILKNGGESPEDAAKRVEEHWERMLADAEQEKQEKQEK